MPTTPQLPSSRCRNVRSGGRSRHRHAPSRSADLSASSPDEYEFPPLPPVAEMKQAIARQRVCQGIPYVLPVDKTKSSVENVFRSNLRVLFTDPYRTEAQHLYAERLQSLASHHFEPNSAGRQYDWRTPLGYSLNLESERARRNFVRTAPATGASDGRPTLAGAQPRSVLYLPITDHVQPEVIKLKEEVASILTSVDIKTDDLDLKPVEAAQSRPTGGAAAAQLASDANPQKDSLPALGGKSKTKFQITDFRETDLNKMADPSGVPLVAVKSPYLTEVKNNEIWFWLHDGKNETERPVIRDVWS